MSNDDEDGPCLAKEPETRSVRQQRHDIVNEFFRWGVALVGTVFATLITTQTYRILDQSELNGRSINELQAAQAVCAMRLDAIDKPGGRLDRIQTLIQDHMFTPKSAP